MKYEILITYRSRTNKHQLIGVIADNDREAVILALAHIPQDQTRSIETINVTPFRPCLSVAHDSVDCSHSDLPVGMWCENCRP